MRAASLAERAMAKWNQAVTHLPAAVDLSNKDEEFKSVSLSGGEKWED